MTEKSVKQRIDVDRFRGPRNASSASPRVIGLITSSLDGDYWRRLIAGLTEHLQESGFSLLCFSPGSQPQFPPDFLDLLRTEYLAGVVISPSSFQSIELANSFPMGSVASRFDADDCLRYIGDLPMVYVGGWAEGVPSVWVRNGIGIRLLMKHLTAVCGRRRIAFVRGTEQHAEAEARFRAWADFCVEHSLPHHEELTEVGGFTLHGGEVAAERILHRNAHAPPDAFVVSNDQMAIGVLRALGSAGLTVPDDVSVVGFDDLEADTAVPPLTTVRQPVFEMGYRAGEILLKRLRNEPVALEHMFDPELVLRASCDPKRSRSSRDTTSAGVGACAFLKGAYSSTEWLMPLLRQPLQEASQARRDQVVNLKDHLAGALELGLRRTKAREREFIACILRSRTRAFEQLEQALTGVESLQVLSHVTGCHMPLLGLDSLTLATLCPPDISGNCQARIAIRCAGFPSKSALERLGTRLACDQLMALVVRTESDPLRVAQPLYLDGNYSGFVVASGTLLDDLMLNELGTLLMLAAARIETATASTL